MKLDEILPKTSKNKTKRKIKLNKKKILRKKNKKSKDQRSKFEKPNRDFSKLVLNKNIKHKDKNKSKHEEEKKSRLEENKSKYEDSSLQNVNEQSMLSIIMDKQIQKSTFQKIALEELNYFPNDNMYIGNQNPNILPDMSSTDRMRSDRLMIQNHRYSN
jgi:hypothetical protein